jgi:hypothetical protein
MSFLSRLAALKQRTGQQIAYDQYSNIKKVRAHDSEALERLAGFAHLTTQQSEEPRSWSPEHVDRVRSQLRGHVFSSRMLRRPIMRGCPKCLRADLEMSTQIPQRFLSCVGIGSCRTRFFAFATDTLWFHSGRNKV